MNDSQMGSGQGHNSYGYGDRGNIVHDVYGPRESLTVGSVYRNDRNARTVSPSRSREWSYKVRATAISVGVFLSGFAYVIVEMVKR